MCWVIFWNISPPNFDFCWNLEIANEFELESNRLELTSRAGVRIDQRKVSTQDTAESERTVEIVFYLDLSQWYHCLPR